MWLIETPNLDKYNHKILPTNIITPLTKAPTIKRILRYLDKN